MVRTALHDAAFNNDTNLILSLLGQDINPDEEDQENGNQTALHIACYEGRVNAVGILLNCTKLSNDSYDTLVKRILSRANKDNLRGDYYTIYRLVTSKSYDHLWDINTDLRTNVINVLKNYYEPRMYRSLFLAGHWKRSHTSLAKFAVKTLKSSRALDNDPLSVVQKIECYLSTQLYNPAGSFKRRLNYIKVKIALSNEALLRTVDHITPIATLPFTQLAPK